MPVETDAGNGKDLFLQHISHDIRGAYFGVGSICAIIYEKVASGEEVPIRLAQSLMDASRHYKYLLDQFLGFSASETASMEKVVYSSFDLPEEVRQLVELNHYLAEEKGIRVEVRVDAGFPGSLLTDKWKITRIFYNVFVNALKFSPPGSFIQIALGIEAGDWTLKIADQGKGIDPDIMTRLFRPYQTHRSDDNPDGVGLGLHIADHLTRLLEGKVSVDSVPGEGACFTFRFPLQSMS